MTGEGCIDGQTPRGKAPIGVARIAADCGVPGGALGGRVAKSAGPPSAPGVGAATASRRPAATVDQWSSRAAAAVP
ncbi:glycerate kinase, partial [Burkholderia thailandensis]|uniref:glycerate kinase n=1 Tax=Burkholderia thailandensis TaxID=57975 RepID=UPI003F68A640